MNLRGIILNEKSQFKGHVLKKSIYITSVKVKTIGTEIISVVARLPGKDMGNNYSLALGDLWGNGNIIHPHMVVVIQMCLSELTRL